MQASFRSSFRSCDPEQSPPVQQRCARRKLCFDGRALPDETLEVLACQRQLFQQWRGSPKLPVLPLELADSVMDFLKPNSIRVPHGSTAMRREAITGQVNDVDIDRP